jgi:hypothetical protein
MTETPESMQLDADPATLAFEALREEVALVRRAVAGLAAERASIDFPDYSETLGQIMRASSAIRQSVKALAEMPALRFFGQRLEPRNRDSCPRSSPFRPASLRRDSLRV